MSKAALAQAIYNEMVAVGSTKEEIIAEFQSNEGLLMTPQGATTYFYNCRRVANGGVFNITAGSSSNPRKEREDTSPDVEDERPLYTVVTPKDGPKLTLLVERTHSFYAYEDALRVAKYRPDQIVVLGLPDIDSNFDILVPYTPTAA